MSRGGNFEVNVWTGGWPIWCIVSYNGKELCQVADTELSDLAYAVKKAMEEANRERVRFKEPHLG